MNIKSIWIIPLLLVMTMIMATGASAAFDVTWMCPISGSGTSTTVSDYRTFSDDPPFVDCQKSGNNLTIEFNITGIEIAEGTPENFNATLYVYQGSKQKLMLPLPIGNRSVSNVGEYIRFTDFGELYTSGIVGKPKWYNNLTEGGYKYYIEVWNLTDTVTGNQLLSSEKGLSSSNPVHFTIDNRGSTAMKAYAAAQSGAEGTEELQSIFGRYGLTTVKDTGKILLILMMGVVAYWYLFRDKKKR